MASWKIVAGEIAAGMFLVSAAVFAVDFEVGEDSMLPIPTSMLAAAGEGAGGELSFMLIDGKKKVKPRIVKATKNGATQLFMDFQGKAPPGSYCLVRGKGKDVQAPDVIAWDFQVSAPELDMAEVDQAQPQGQVALSGKFFGKSPKVYLACDWKGKRKYKPCRITESTYFDDPYDKSDKKFSMDVDNGDSKLVVTLPSYPADAVNLAIEVRSADGVGACFLRGASPKPGDILAWEQKGTIDHKWFFFPVVGYLYRSFACDKWTNFVGMAGGWALVTNSKLPSDPFTRGKYDVELYAVKYQAAYDAAGASPVVASGLMAIPKGLKSQSVTFHSFQHGTMLMKASAPSVSMGPEMGVALIFAVENGQVVILPDHIGLGAAALDKGMEKVYHPYCQATPDAVGDAYMIPAAKSFLTTKDPELADKVTFATPLLGGYSEGGYITLALCRELEVNGPTYGVTAVAAVCPMAGPHSLSHVMLNRLLDENLTYPVQYFAPYLLVTYNNSYQRCKAPSDYFATPYDTTVVPLIDGYHSSSLVEDAMPASKIPAQALQKAFAETLRKGTGDFFNDIKANDLIDTPQKWYPKAKTYLAHGETDDCVMCDNSVLAENYFAVSGKPTDSLRLKKVPEGALITAFALLGQIKHALYFPYVAGEYWEWVDNGYKFTASEGGAVPNGH